MEILQEITPLSDDRLYVASYYFQNQLDFPIHYHEDFELNLTSGAEGSLIVGAKVEGIRHYDLTLMFPDVIHCYKRAEEENCDSCEVTVVQFSKQMTASPLLNTVQFEKIHAMLTRQVSGLKFSENVAKTLKGKIQSLAYRSDFESGVRFLEVLNYLANVSPSEVEIIGMDSSKAKYSRSNRIRKIIKYTEDNYNHKISLEEIGATVGMSPSSVSRFFKSRTGHNYWDFLTDYRLECAQRVITGTDMTIAEVAYSCGFNSLSNFNKLFRLRFGKTPREHRDKFKHSSKA